jgi:predicted alpha-1,2-mannosidase
LIPNPYPLNPGVLRFSAEYLILKKQKMKRQLLAIALLAACVNAVAVTDPVSYVNPLVGTASKHSLSTGNTYPAIALPWGMNFWTPQTGKMGDGWAYVYTADKIRGIKQTHQPSPWINDYGQFSLLPQTGAPVFDQDQRASWFSHKAEDARPYYYKVYLADYDATVEITPTERAAVMRVTYPETDKALFVIDAFDNGSWVQIIPEQNRVVGYTTKNSGGVTPNFRNWFVLQFDRPFSYKAAVTDGQINEGVLTADARHAGAIVGFAPTWRGEQVNVQIASSFISLEQAEINLGEVKGRSFDEVCAAGRDRWNEVLGRIEVKDDNVDHLRTFYSCLYRSVLFPRSLYEVDAQGQIVHYSPYEEGGVHPGYLFTDTGFWDTFRCLFPLLNLVYPEMNEMMQAGLVNTYLESGFLPEWASPGHRGCMVGNNSASVVADAYLKGCRGYDIETLWQAVKHGANAVHPKVSSTGRLGWEDYNRLGYVPCDDIRESAARTLEYAYADWCIYQLGLALGKSKKELKPFREHAFNYRNLFDPLHNLMRGRMKDGSWMEPYNPLQWGNAFTEGNAWHYTWSVFHDPQGLIDLMGGEDIFCHMLDSVFSVPPLFDESYYGGVIHEIREMQIMNMGNYAHGNQPIQHMIYLYGYAGQPWKTQYWIREVMDRLYNALPDGYCGDEDNGQTSAWYVFSAMGFYPVCPGSGEYVLGTPYFDSLKLHLQGGKTLVIDARGNSPEARYVDALTLNGEAIDRNYLTHDELMAGGHIVCTMSATPNTERGTGPQSAPYSFSRFLNEKK